MGSLVIVENQDGNKINYFFTYSGGGDTIVVENQEIVLVSINAPIFQLLKGKNKGDRVSSRNDVFEIVEVE